MNDVLRDFLYKFVIVYLDGVCIYSRTLSEHLEHLRLVLKRRNVITPEITPKEMLLRPS
jgi:hypothetical protein